MAEADYRTPGLGPAASQWVRAASCLAIGALLGACLGGPHPVPPLESRGISTSSGQLPAGAPTGFGVAGTGASVVDAPQNPVLGAAGVGASAPILTPPTAPAAGSGGPNAAGAAAGTAGTAAPASNMPSSGAAGDTSCEGALSLARGMAPDNVLFLVDRSADMAGDFQGQPRWQQSDSALVSAITPLVAAPLKVGVLFYPSAASAASACVGPAWLCPAATTDQTTCGVSAMGSNDQVALQPAMQALAALSGPGLFQPIAGTGVPLRESIERVNSALSFQPITGHTSIVLMANAQPSCRWDRAQAANMLSAWRTQRSIPTHVIALPGTNPSSMNELSALASAGGQSGVLAPSSSDALRSELQSIAAGSLTSCTLTLDPPVTTPQDAHVIVGVHGVEQDMPRSDGNGVALWTLSPDGKTLNLLAGLCAAAQRGDYDSLTVRVGCARFPPALAPTN